MSEANGAVSEAGPPNWVHDAIRNAYDELRLFASTLWAITAHPMRFAGDWATRRTRALNPFAYIATCASLCTGFEQVLAWLGAVGDDSSFGTSVYRATAPFAQYTVLGVLAHVLLLPVAPRRRLIDSLAVTLYAGGAALIGYVLVALPLVVLWVSLGRPQPHDGVLHVLPPEAARWGARLMLLMYAAFVRTMWLGLAGLHRNRRGVAALATLGAIVLLAFALPFAGMHGTQGLELVIYRVPNGGWHGWGMDMWD